MPPLAVRSLVIRRSLPRLSVVEKAYFIGMSNFPSKLKNKHKMVEEDLSEYDEGGIFTLTEEDLITLLKGETLHDFGYVIQLSLLGATNTQLEEIRSLVLRRKCEGGKEEV